MYQPSYARCRLIALAIMCIHGQDIFAQGTVLRCVPRSVSVGPSYSGGYSYYYPRSYSSTYSAGYGTINGVPVSTQVNGVPFPNQQCPTAANSQVTRSNTSVSRSVSFKKDGKRVSISETPSGITAKIGGKTIRAKDLDDLKEQSPEAYDYYKDRMGSTFAKATARGSARGAAGGSAGGGPGANMVGNQEESSSRSVSIAENGKQITITENDRGIMVRANQRTIRAKNAADLARRSPEAFRLYEEHMTNAAPALQADAGLGDGNNAQDMLRDQINQMRNEHAGNDQMQGLFDQMLQEIDQQ